MTAGGVTLSAQCYRSSASRYYYAAYQIASAVLLYLGLQPPAGREAWSHEATPELLRETLVQRRILSRGEGNRLKSRLEVLYTLRVIADYVPTRPVTATDAEAARRDVGIVRRTLLALLPR